jgi:hypothetical protein
MTERIAKLRRVSKPFDRGEGWAKEVKTSLWVLTILVGHDGGRLLQNDSGTVFIEAWIVRALQ